MVYTAYERPIPTVCVSTYLLPSRKIHVPTEVGYSESKMGALQSTNQPTDQLTTEPYMYLPTHLTYLPDLPVSPNTCT